MSVILDALQKARTDRRKNQDEPHPNSVARVLEPVVVPAAGATATPPARGRQWLLPVLVILVVLLLAACAGVAYVLLFTQVQKLAASAPAPAGEIKQPALAGEAAVAGATAGEATLPVAPPPGTSPAAINGQPAAANVPLVSPALPPPAPLSELPIQPPATAAAGAATAGAAAAAPDFKLGSIVCEGVDCIAHLNSRTVRVGDQVRQYRVAQINNTSLVLQGPTPGDVITLSLYD